MLALENEAKWLIKCVICYTLISCPIMFTLTSLHLFKTKQQLLVLDSLTAGVMIAAQGRKQAVGI